MRSSVQFIEQNGKTIYNVYQIKKKHSPGLIRGFPLKKVSNTLSVEISSVESFVGKKYSSVKNFVTKRFFRHFSSLFTDEISTDKVPTFERNTCGCVPWKMSQILRVVHLPRCGFFIFKKETCLFKMKNAFIQFLKQKKLSSLKSNSLPNLVFFIRSCF